MDQPRSADGERAARARPGRQTAGIRRMTLLCDTATRVRRRRGDRRAQSRAVGWHEQGRPTAAGHPSRFDGSHDRMGQARGGLATTVSGGTAEADVADQPAPPGQRAGRLELVEEACLGAASSHRREKYSASGCQQATARDRGSRARRADQERRHVGKRRRGAARAAKGRSTRRKMPSGRARRGEGVTKSPANRAARAPPASGTRAMSSLGMPAAACARARQRRPARRKPVLSPAAGNARGASRA